MKIPLTPPPLSELLERTQNHKEFLKIASQASSTPAGKYLHWDILRHREPPEGLDVEDWWLGVKIARSQVRKVIPGMRDVDGNPFYFATTDQVFRALVEIDRNASGQIQMSEEVTNPETRNRYIVNSLIEEAITSSQLEGASTTTRVAKEMIRSGRKATNRSEQMILNNYQAMSLVREFEGPLTPRMVFELHRVLTDDVLDDQSKAGTFREPDEAIQVTDGTGTVLHVPPVADELPDRLEKMCRFANRGDDDDPFIHPVLRAMMLHFWLAYDHPFVDGNGRTARALFYWAMLSRGYWLTEFLSISRILKKAPAQYARSFLYTETDDNDVTYFLDFQLRVIRQSINELQKHLSRKTAQVRKVEAMLRQSADLNHRQLALLSHALRHPGQTYTIESHKRSHRVVYETARTDLMDLAERDLLTRRKSGRQYVFRAPADLGERLRSAEEHREA